MGLKLVVNNDDKKEKTFPTCRHNCELFDSVTGQCGINDDINPDDPFVAARCGEMIYKDPSDDSVYVPPHQENSYTKFTLIEDEFEWEYEDESIFYELKGDKFNRVDSTYPLQPDYPSNRDDAVWYVSPDKEWGCWIINKSKQRFMAISNNEAKPGWTKNVYKSPYPLHNHKSSLTLASRMAWYVDEDGYGQYVILANGNVSMISSLKPENWRG
ncbi:hypothetical protein [Ferdinandcohnia sp. SAFN-114]|uniref:hypothetical protein n=1 Tax=Ferdinandcohnia sp. SAFN-114 TaxID=3387275 RepID=UPI003F7F6B74